MLEHLYLESATHPDVDTPRARRLPFSGPKNFRDLGGYAANDGRTVRWGLLYRSDGLQRMTDADLRRLDALGLGCVIDFRADPERLAEPDRLPAGSGLRRVAIPILDSSTKIWHDSREEFARNLRLIDSQRIMIQTNVELATQFTPEMARFIQEVFSAGGRPLLFHCAAGKDRTGFAAAILLRMLGVPQEIVMQDYLLTNRYLLAAYKWNLAMAQWVRGKRFVTALKGFMEARPEYLNAAFDALERSHGSFQKYVRQGLGLTGKDLEQLKSLYLE